VPFPGTTSPKGVQCSAELNSLSGLYLIGNPIERAKIEKNISIKICASECLHIYLQAITCAFKQDTMRRDVYQAIADPTRRAIISLIALQAMTPNALAEHFNITRQGVSNHIKILTECELVKQEQHGREIYYTLEVEKLKEVDKWLEQYRSIWENQFNQLDKILATIKSQEK
jgi:DNA-binding transcriptional ArsR family regulator